MHKGMPAAHSKQLTQLCVCVSKGIPRDPSSYCPTRWSIGNSVVDHVADSRTSRDHDSPGVRALAHKPEQAQETVV